MNTHLRRLLALAVLGLAALLSLEGCSTVPVTGRRQLNLISQSDEMQLGLASFNQIKANTPINHDPAINAMVQRVGKRIAAVASPALPNAQWEFVVFESKEANAFCLPGGKVGIYTGLLPITKDDAGLATVVGHEVGHAVARHGAERMSQQMALQGLGQVGGSFVSPQYQSLAMAAFGVGARVGLQLPFSRKQESEADHIGIMYMYMAKAGYDPKAAIAFWQRFMDYNQRSGGNPNSFFAQFLRTHPLDEVRIQQLKQWLPEAEAEYAKSGKK